MKYSNLYDNSREEKAYFEWTDGCYDEDGMGVTCDDCYGNIFWKDGNYICKDCGKVFERVEYFNYIGADPPDSKCIFCKENYPICKRWCSEIEIGPDDLYF